MGDALMLQGLQIPCCTNGTCTVGGDVCYTVLQKRSKLPIWNILPKLTQIQACSNSARLAVLVRKASDRLEPLHRSMKLGV